MISAEQVILGIESSCDDTAVAVVDRAGRVLSSVVASQDEVHAKFGGVYPEFASRAHCRSIFPAVEKALADASVTPGDLGAIGVTRGPGLVGSLLVGLNAAAGLGLGWGVPVVGVNHLRGHLRSADLEVQRVKYPAVVLLVSGGHSILARMDDPGTIVLLGSTRDDSLGEVYDKVGRMLGLAYPAGALVDRLAKTGEATIPFPRPLLSQGLDFSFSGLKSAVARYMAAEPEPVPQNVAASFVAACMEITLTKCQRAMQQCSPASLVVVGGVAASPQLRAGAARICEELGVELCLPPLRWSTDNAAMIALATWEYVERGILPRPLPVPRLSILEY